MLKRAIACLFIFGFFGGCAYAAEPVTIRLQVFDRPLAAARGAETFRSAVNARLGTAGRVEIVNVPISPLDALRAGKADLVAIPTDELVNLKQAERFALFDLPFFFDKLDEVAAIENGAVGEILLSSLYDERIVGVGYWNTGINQLFDRRDRIRHAIDLKGVRFGTSVPERSLASTESLQAHIIRVDEATQALADSRLDVAELPLELAVIDPSKALTPMSIVAANYRPFVMVVATTREIWKKWSFQVQSVIAEEVKAAGIRITADAVQQDAVALSELERRGFKPVALLSDAFQSFRELARSGWSLLDKDLLEIALDALQQYRRSANPVQRKALLLNTHTEILFATDRFYDSSLDASHRFGSTRDDALGGAARLGIASFTPDLRHQVAGQLTEMRFDAQPFRSSNEFVEALISRLKTARKKEILIYVHGYNVTLVHSAASAATLARDSRFAGVPIVFSWPSEGSVPAYPADEEEVALSDAGFVNFLRLIRGIDGLERLHLVSHSMGARLAVLGLKGLDKGLRARRLFHHVVFAAPDLYTIALDQALPSIQDLSDRITLYASKRDGALKCSQAFHSGHPRAGLTGVDIVVRRGMDTIDVTNADAPQTSSQLCSRNHSYITQNQHVLDDLHQLMNLDLEPARRDQLRPKPYGDLQYWQFD